MYYYDKKTDVMDNRELAILKSFHNVVVTPHMAFYTSRGHPGYGIFFAEKLPPGGRRGEESLADSVSGADRKRKKLLRGSFVKERLDADEKENFLCV